MAVVVAMVVTIVVVNQIFAAHTRYETDTLGELIQAQRHETTTKTSVMILVECGKYKVNDS